MEVTPQNQRVMSYGITTAWGREKRDVRAERA
jgi:hypothetical protein